MVEAPRKHPGGTQEAPRRHPGGTKETPRRHPGGTQEAPRRHPGGTKGSRMDFGAKSAKTIEFYCRKWRDRPFCRRVAKVPTTKSAACAQK